MAKFRNSQTAALDPVDQARPVTVRKNAYAAPCTNCGVWVEAEEGRLENVAGKWVVSHIPPCPVAEEDKPYTGWVEPATLPVPEGRYTIKFEDGDYKTLRVRRQDEDSSFMPNVGVISYLSGSNNDADYTGFANFTPTGGVKVWTKHQANHTLMEALKVLIASPQAASKAYAAMSGNCGICGRTLTTPESLAAGIGPVCAEKAGW